MPIVCEVLHTKQKVLSTDVYCFFNNSALSQKTISNSLVVIQQKLMELAEKMLSWCSISLVHIPEHNEIKSTPGALPYLLKTRKM